MKAQGYRVTCADCGARGRIEVKPPKGGLTTCPECTYARMERGAPTGIHLIAVVREVDA